MDDRSTDGLLSEEQAALVLDRATELESGRGNTIDVHDLRQAALDAGIAPEAFEQALAELRSGLDAIRSRESQTLAAGARSLSSSISQWARRTALGVLGFAIAAASAALTYFGIDSEVTLIFSIVLVLLGVSALVAMRRRDRAVLAFEFDLAALWIGFAVAWMLIEPGDAGAVLEGSGWVGSVAAVVGGLIVGLPSSDKALAATPEDEGLLLPEAQPS